MNRCGVFVLKSSMYIKWVRSVENGSMLRSKSKGFSDLRHCLFKILCAVVYEGVRLLALSDRVANAAT